MFGDRPCPPLRVYDEGKVFTIPGLLTPDECAAIRGWTDDKTWEAEAPITTSAGFVQAADVRNNERLIVDSHDWAEALWKRVGQAFTGMADLHPIGLNERFRFYRYGPGQYFKPHYDGAYHRPGTMERSLFTLMLYLSGGVEGGDTRFHEAGVVVTPEEGLACGFWHEQLHAGEEVVAGAKWVLRTDVMFDLSRI